MDDSLEMLSFRFEERVPVELLRLILAHALPPSSQQSNFYLFALVNYRWSLIASELLLSVLSIPGHIASSPVKTLFQDLEENGLKLLDLLVSNPQKGNIVKTLIIDCTEVYLAAQLLLCVPNLEELIAYTRDVAHDKNLIMIPPLRRLKYLVFRATSMAVPFDCLFPKIGESRLLKTFTLQLQDCRLPSPSAFLSQGFDTIHHLTVNVPSTSTLERFLPSVPILQTVQLHGFSPAEFEVVSHFVSQCIHLSKLSLRSDFYIHTGFLIPLPPHLHFLEVADLAVAPSLVERRRDLDISLFFTNLKSHPSLTSLSLTQVPVWNPFLYGVFPNLNDIQLRRCTVPVPSPDGTGFRSGFGWEDQVSRNVFQPTFRRWLEDGNNGMRNITSLSISVQGYHEATGAASLALMHQLSKRKGTPVILSVFFESSAAAHNTVHLLPAFLRFRILRIGNISDTLIQSHRGVSDILTQLLRADECAVEVFHFRGKILFSRLLEEDRDVTGKGRSLKRLKALIINEKKEESGECQRKWCEQRGVDFTGEEWSTELAYTFWCRYR